MQPDEFVQQVQQRAHLASSAEAEKAIRATLETLTKRLDADLTQRVSNELPGEVRPYWDHPAPSSTSALSDFSTELSVQEGVDRGEAVRHARAVLEVLNESVIGIVDIVHEQLPDAYRTLFADSPGQSAQPSGNSLKPITAASTPSGDTFTMPVPKHRGRNKGHAHDLTNPPGNAPQPGDLITAAKKKKEASIPFD